MNSNQGEGEQEMSEEGEQSPEQPIAKQDSHDPSGESATAKAEAVSREEKISAAEDTATKEEGDTGAKQASFAERTGASVQEIVMGEPPAPEHTKITKADVGKFALDVLIAVLAGLIVGVAYFFFQNSNGFAPGGIGGLATMTYHLLDGKLDWAYLMMIYNVPIFILMTIFVDRKLGIILIIYLAVQSFGTQLLGMTGLKPYCAANNGDDFEIVFATLATGVISGLGFSIMLRRFGASGGTYAISALIKKAKPAANIPKLSFFMDSGVVIVSFFVYGMKVIPVMCTFLNLFIADVVVDYFLAGGRQGFKFEVITDKADELSEELMSKLMHGVTQVRVEGMYTHCERKLVMCIVRKRHVGEMLKILKKYPHTFATLTRVNDVYGKFIK